MAANVDKARFGSEERAEASEWNILMVWAILPIMGIIVVLYAVYLAVRFKRGLAIARHLHQFEMIYDEIYQENGSRVIALEQAFRAFETCPGLRELTVDEVQAAVVVLALAPDPKWIVKKLVLKFDSRHMSKAFRDLNFLSKVVDVGVRRG